MMKPSGAIVGAAPFIFSINRLGAIVAQLGAMMQETPGFIDYVLAQLWRSLAQLGSLRQLPNLSWEWRSPTPVG